MVTFHIISIFPEIFESYLEGSIIGKAENAGKIAFKFYDPREWADNKHGRVDGKPYGGGPGMVMQAMPILKAVKAAKGRKKDIKVIILSPRGEKFDNKKAESLKKKRHIVLICGRYEGIDARVKKALKAEELSVGPYTLTGGELPAMVLVDAVARRVPGILGKESSIEERRVTSGEVYTRPGSIKFRGREYKVPEVLLSGDHAEIETWRSKKDKK